MSGLLWYLCAYSFSYRGLALRESSWIAMEASAEMVERSIPNVEVIIVEERIDREVATGPTI